MNFSEIPATIISWSRQLYNNPWRYFFSCVDISAVTAFRVLSTHLNYFQRDVSDLVQKDDNPIDSIDFQRVI